MLRYNVTKVKPYGKEYHGPGNPYTRAGLALYHLTNRPFGVIKAKRAGCKRVDIDCMHTRDGVAVANHSLDAMGKEGFKAEGVLHRTIDNLPWSRVSLLEVNGIHIHTMREIFEEAHKQDIIVAVDLKGVWTTAMMRDLVKTANETKAWIYVKCDPQKAHLRWALNLARERGLWTRYNGSYILRKPR